MPFPNALDIITPKKQMHGWSNHTIKMKSIKETIEIEIALIDKKSCYITRALAVRFQQRRFSLSYR